MTRKYAIQDILDLSVSLVEGCKQLIYSGDEIIIADNLKDAFAQVIQKDPEIDIFSDWIGLVLDELFGG